MEQPVRVELMMAISRHVDGDQRLHGRRPRRVGSATPDWVTWLGDLRATVARAEEELRCLTTASSFPPDSVGLEQRQSVARAVTDIHCGSTGAPRSFVHVVFDEAPDTRFAEPYYLDAFNRAGRAEEVKQALLSDLLGAFAEITGVDAAQLSGPDQRRAGVVVDGGRHGPPRARRRDRKVVLPRSGCGRRLAPVAAETSPRGSARRLGS